VIPTVAGPWIESLGGESIKSNASIKCEADDDEIRIGVWRGVFTGVEDRCRPPALWVGHLRNGRKSVSGVARLQGIEESGKAGPGDSLRSPWQPPTIRPCDEILRRRRVSAVQWPSRSPLAVWSPKLSNNGKTLGRMARGGHRLPKVSSGPAMP
jgi:hypothetical protein